MNERQIQLIMQIVKEQLSDYLAEELAEDMPRCWRLEAGRLSETPAFLPAAAAAGLRG